MALPELALPEQAETSPRIHLTSAALERIHEMLEEEDLLAEGGLRITVQHGGGCSAPLQFGMVMEVEPEVDDVVLMAGGVRLFLAPRSVWSVDGLQVDFVDSPFLGSGFAFRHPRGSAGRSC